MSAPAGVWSVPEWRERSTTFVANGRWTFQPGIGLHKAVRGESPARLLSMVPAGSVLHLADDLAATTDLSADLPEGWERRGEPSSWRLVARHGQVGPFSRVVATGAAPNGAAGPWDSGSPELMAGGMARFLAHTGHAWSDTVASTVRSIILSTHPRERGGTQLSRNLVLPQVCSERMEGPWASWRRALTDAEAGARFVHSFDANAQYLSPWQSVELGLGEPVETGYGDVSYAGSASVFELASPTPESVEREPLPLLPPIWARAGERYVTGQTIRRCVEVYGAPPRVTRGWAWPQASRYLRGAGEILRDARAGLLVESGPEAGAALAAVKACYRTFVGRLNSDYVHEAGSAWRRPDWGHLLRASARVNLHRRLAKLTCAPFAVVVDGLVFASDVEDPGWFAQSIGLPIGGGLGQFSVTGSWPASQVAGALVADTGRKVMGVLKSAGRA